MTSKDTKYQQQILFDEKINASQEKGNKQVQVASQVIVDNDSWQEAEVQAVDVEIASNKKQKPRWLWRVIAVALPVLIAIEAFQFFVEGFQSSPFVTGVYAMVFACISIIIGKVAFKEVLGLRQLKRNVQVKHRIYQYIQEDKTSEIIKTCEKINERLPLDLINEYESKWLANTKHELSASEITALYDQQVLAVVDKRALNVIAKYSTESVVLVAVSPVAIVDMALIFWRNIKLLDELAHLYGLHLSYWSRVRLIKQVFVNMAYAGASELVADIGVEVLGADMLSKVSARFAQGMGAGLLTARLGLKAMQECRPLPFTKSPPGLSHVRKNMLKRLAKITKL